MNGQAHYINDDEIASCGINPTNCGNCRIPQVDITDKLLEGTSKISSAYIAEDESMTMYIEVLTSSKPERPFILRGPNFDPWINETSNSFDLQALGAATRID